MSDLLAPSQMILNPNDSSELIVASAGRGSATGGVSILEIVQGVIPPPKVTVTEFDHIESLTITTGAEADYLRVASGPEIEVIDFIINTAAGSDTVIMQGLRGTTVVNTGADSDSVQVSATGTGSLTVNLADGDDEFELLSLSHGVTTSINAGAGDDEFIVQSLSGGSGTVTTLTGGAGADQFIVSGEGVPAAIGTAGLQLQGHGGSGTDGTNTLIYNPGTADHQPASPARPNGHIGIPGYARVNYTAISDVIVRAAPAISFVETSYQINEGQDVTFQVDVDPLGNTLAGAPEFLLREAFGEAFATKTGETNGVSRYALTLTWNQLVALGIDNGTAAGTAYQVGVRSRNTVDMASTAFTTLTVRNVDATVSLTGGSQTTVGSPYTINFSAIDPSPADVITGWQINWGDGTVETYGAAAASASRVYQQSGTANITVEALTPSDTPASASLSLTVQPNPASVSAGGPYSIAEGESLTLQANPLIGTPTNYAWDLNGDGSFTDAVGQRPTISWTQLQSLGINDNGTYEVRVRATYAAIGGGTETVDSNAVPLAVANVAPQGTLNVVSIAQEGQPVTVSWSGQSDVANADQAAGFTYSYDFDNDGVFEQSLVSHSQAQFTPSDDGVYSVRAAIHDQDGGTTIRTLEIVVGDVAPTLQVVGSGTSVEGQTYSLNFAATDPGADTVNQWIVNWGDGTVTSYTEASPTATHQFVNDGNFTVRVQAINEDGQFTASDHAVIVANAAPQVVDLTATSAIEGGITVVTGRVLDAGVNDQHSLTVNWGDGSAAEVISLPAGTRSFELRHIYTQDSASGYQVSVTASDGLTTGTAQTAAIVANVAPTATLQITGTRTRLDGTTWIAEIDEGGQVVINGTIADAGTADTHSVQIEWGDGQSTTATVNQTNRTFTATHTYGDDAPTGTSWDRYLIRATITDDANGTVSVEQPLAIVNTAPEITDLSTGLPAGAFVIPGTDLTITASFTDLIAPPNETFTAQVN